jgi:hypothetical protein
MNGANNVAIIQLSPFLSVYCSFSVSFSIPTEWRLRSRLSVSLLPLLFFLFIGLIRLFRLCRNRFRLNDGFGTGFRWDTFGFSALSPFLSLYRSLLLALSQCHFHYRLNGGFEAGFRRKTFGFSTPSPFISLCRSHRSSGCVACASLSLQTEWRLRSRLLMECIRLRQREVIEAELALLAGLLMTNPDICHCESGHSSE